MATWGSLGAWFDLGRAMVTVLMCDGHATVHGSCATWLVSRQAAISRAGPIEASVLLQLACVILEMVLRRILRAIFLVRGRVESYWPTRMSRSPGSVSKLRGERHFDVGSP